MANFVFILIILISFKIANGDPDPDPPKNFPKSMTLELKPFVTWAEEHNLTKVWTATPRTANDVLEAVNWAMENPGCRIRASGARHSWVPITISKRDQTPEMEIPCIILLKTKPHLNKVGVNPDKKSFWAEPGVTMEDLTFILEQHGRGFASIPAVGPITLGGVLAIGGHGASTPAKDEKMLEGHTFGTLSNLILSFTAVMFDQTKGRYTLQTIDRSNPIAKYFLVNLGRTFLTNVTMRIGPLQYLQCVSRTDVTAPELFTTQQSLPSLPVTIGPLLEDKSFAGFLEQSGRVEAIVFPYSEFVWLKNWYVKDQKPLEAREVKQPYNYPFSDEWPGTVTTIIDDIRNGREAEALNLGTTMYLETVKGLKGQNDSNQSANIWGTARNVQLYIRPSTLKVTADGYGLVTSRSNIQDVVHNLYRHYKGWRGEYLDLAKFPLNGPLEIRVSSLDYPEDSGVEGAEAPSISPGNPNPKKDRLGTIYDTVVWMNALSFVKTQELFKAMRNIELSNYWGKGTGQLRPEYSKGWAYKQEDGPWYPKNASFLFDDFHKQTVKNYWKETVNAWNQLDPHAIFSNKFLDDLMTVE